jgi:hypothetical protein
MHGMIKKLELPKLDSGWTPPNIARAGPSFDVQRAALNARLGELKIQVGKPPAPPPEPLPMCYGASFSYTVRPIRNGRNIGIIRSDRFTKIEGMEEAKRQSKNMGLPIQFVRWDVKPGCEKGDAILLIQELRATTDLAHGGSNQLIHEWRFSNPMPKNLRGEDEARPRGWRGASEAEGGSPERAEGARGRSAAMADFG